MQKYKAKIDLLLFIPLAAIMLGSILHLAFIAINELDTTASVVGWVFALLMLLLSACFIHMFLATYYAIDGDKLIVRSGVLYNNEITIPSIRKIKKTRTFISAPATSLDRLEILYNRFDSVIVSPKDKQGFIAALIKLNPEIEVIG